MHTPGHTDESMSYVLTDLDAGKEPVMVFTGDALFVGDVGRTDLYGPEEAKRLASSLYDSIFNKILPLGDEVILCPSHGAGSVCGGAIASREPWGAKYPGLGTPPEPCPAEEGESGVRKVQG
ncbi:MAG: hypothetical protein AB3K77_05065 [Methanosarcinaceae archaeon]